MFHECAPLVTMELKRPFPPWITADIRSLIRRRNYPQNSLKGDRNNTDLQTNYKNLKREVTATLHRGRSIMLKIWRTARVTGGRFGEFSDSWYLMLKRLLR